jgi:hypothetical protein
MPPHDATCWIPGRLESELALTRPIECHQKQKLNEVRAARRAVTHPRKGTDRRIPWL